MALSLAGSLSASERHVLVLDLTGVVGPATSDFVVRGIERGERDGAELVILRMDTPGGLDKSMRDIIQKILASSVPVATYVAPQGSRAASAGTYILYASHIAAMAPATNLGAATPVQLAPGGVPGTPKPEPPGKRGDEQEKETEDDQGDDDAPVPSGAMERKLVNDAVAYIRGLALERGRNAEWAEKAVREAASLTAEDALAEGVIEYIAPDVTSLLEKIDGLEVEIRGETKRLETAEIAVQVLEPDWRSRILAILTNPNVAYILMLLGVYGLFFELSNPGNVLPGVAGAICLLLALYAFHVLPVNYAGLALMGLGIAFIVAEAFTPTFGAFGIGGAIAFLIGSLILMDTEVEGFELSIPVVLTFTAISVAFFIAVITMVVRQRQQPLLTGRQEMVGSIGEAIAAFESHGHIQVHGELWEAQTSELVEKGQKVRVKAMKGLVLRIEPLQEES